ncbi:MAG: histidine phosphatase family protein [Pseudomonadota bacterium]
MQVILVRHAIAHERSRARWPKDALRPLTPAGIRKFEKAARGLARHLPRNATLLTSPFMRALETATILQRVAQLRDLTECAELAAGQPVRHAIALLRKQRGRCVVLVGHEPHLSLLLSQALGGVARLKFSFKKGGAACIDFGKTVEPGGATLIWMMPPRVLRALA